MKKWSVLIVFSIVAVVMFGCQKEPQEPQMSEEGEGIQEVSSEGKGIQEVSSEGKAKVEVELINQEGIPIGTAIIKEEKEGVQISVEANHLPPGLHGFHIHEKGLCEPPTFETAGGHFNPFQKKHGFDDPEGPHAGDMKNLEVQNDGTVKQKFINEMVTLEKGAPNSLFSQEGTTIMIHANPDDYKSQPAGNAGERIACGVISKSDK